MKELLVDIPPRDSALKIPLSNSLGLSLLYASAFFLPNLSSTGAYFLPSHNIFSLVVLPTAVAVFTCMIAIHVLDVAARAWLGARIATISVILALSVLMLIALKGIFLAAESNWENLVPRGHDMVSNLRDVKGAAFLAVALVAWTQRRRLSKLTRLLSSLGLAFGVLAVFKILLLMWARQPASLEMTHTAPVPRNESQVGGSMAITQSRRVIWIIFDETDFDRAFTSGARPTLPNLARLQQISVFATHAFSPASDTIYSVPALLAGTPMGGAGIHIDRSASLWIERPDGTRMPLSQATSIFGAVDSLGGSSSVLGFYHPYCKLFVLSRCESLGGPYIDTLDAALWANLPDTLFTKRHWEDITEESIRLLPEYLARNDALTFIHLNFPHLPADYADRTLRFPTSTNPLTEYSHNLALMDQIVGTILENVQRQASRHDSLLIVSTDHWLRNMWYQADVKEKSRLIPFMAWKVGETKGYVLSQRISTIRTEAMILDYLKGNLETQADIARWWANQPVFPSFIRPTIHY